jgi:hypothetical protein
MMAGKDRVGNKQKREKERQIEMDEQIERWSIGEIWKLCGF